MKKSGFLAALASTMLLMAVANTASAVGLTLDAVNQRSSSGALSTLAFKTCAPAAGNGCISPTNAWVVANSVVGSTATWAWDGTTLTSSGLFWSTSHISSNPFGPAVISDRVTDLVVNTGTLTTTASSYQCIEGTFLGGVGAHGCANLNLGGDFLYDSSVAYNVGGNANCVQRTIAGDDISTGNPRGLMNAAAGGGCDAVDGAYNLWTIVTDTTGSGGTLILSNGVPISAAGTSYLTFSVAAPVPVPAAVWLFGSALGLLGVARRRAVTAA